MQPTWIIFLLLFSSLLGATPSFTVVHSANRGGEVEPCGCKVHQTGGLNRMTAWVEQWKKTAPPLVLDSGDTFFSSSSLSPFREEMEKRRAALIAEVYQEMGLVALTPGEKDFSLGENHLRELEKMSGAKFLSANLEKEEGGKLFPSYLITEKNGKKVAILGVSGSEAFAGVKGVKVKPVLPALKETLETMKNESFVALIVLSHAGLVEDRLIQKFLPTALILGAHSLDSVVEKGAEGQGMILQEQHEGQQISSVDFENGEWKTPRLVDLTKEWDKKNGARKKMEALKAAGIQESENHPKPKKTGNAYLAHPFLCRSCHEKQYTFWENTKHASGILVLYSKNSHKDPECIGCHSLGFREKNGFQRFSESIQLQKKNKHFAEDLLKEVFARDSAGALDSRLEPERHKKLHQKYFERIHFYENKNQVVKNFLGVQCEHCHGTRIGHPQNLKVGQRSKVSKETCNQCHQPPNATSVTSEMVERVSCPLINETKKGTE